MPRYSTVSGTLPLADIPIAGVREQQGERILGSGFARVPLLVTAPGMIHLKLNSVEGMELRIDEKPVNLTSEFSIDLPVGPHRLTFSVDHTLRTAPLQLELVDVPSGGNAEFRY